MKGLELSRTFYDAYGKPMLEEQFSQLLPFLAVGLFGRDRNVSVTMMRFLRTMILNLDSAFFFRTSLL